MNINWKLTVQILLIVGVVLTIVQVVSGLIATRNVAFSLAGLLLCVCTLAIIEAIERKG